MTGADAFELDYKTDITKIYNSFHNTTTFIGNIDPSGVLALGTADDVQKKTLEVADYLQKFKSFYSKCWLCYSTRYTFRKSENDDRYCKKF